MDFNATKNKRSSAITKVKNLKPGKTYQINFYVASTINKIVKQGCIPGYAKDFFIETYLSNGKKLSAHMMPLNAGATWFKQTITFKAAETELTLKFSAFTDSDTTFSYAHIFVDHNSIEEIQQEEPLDY
ncbi:hypothetical protein [Dyadobacter chenwenxiniae]|uniref:hypothetical protein n=1 Tax=Dyadobacter chenwenxiniae TaxID=2906456 RepID=UPI001F42547F|nr:hypothetical protein [Dyadobacter chenwenxiniae]